MSDHDHPSRETLLAFLDEDLPAREAEAVGRHLDSCRECQMAVARWDDGEAGFATRLLEGDPYAGEPQRQEALERVQAIVLDEHAVDLVSTPRDLEENPDVPTPPAGRALKDPNPPPQIGRYLVRGVLGRGGFGVIYLAYDAQLDRQVAIKVPRLTRVSGPQDLEAYLAEARLLAGLDHPGIVPVYDVGMTDDHACYVVSKYVAGADLRRRMQQSRLSYTESAGIVARIAEALHYAHLQNIVHRDVKPGNILLDGVGQPYLCDFGLAIRDEDCEERLRYGGTPAYMSPEQARGEGHRIDGRSDIFSLGIVFYELLTGRHPFRSKDAVQILEQIVSREPRPPRQVDDSIPVELERICLAALSKHISERYTTAKDFAEELRLFLRTAVPAAVAGPASAPEAETDSGDTSGPPDTPRQQREPGGPTVRIVPKGLRAFDEHDADFFPELLPGPRDRQGWPESIRFWKTGLEERDGDATFPVGLVYGPSGCGKSSLIRAGLVPALGRHVTPVCIEASATDTEARLLRRLRKACPGLMPGWNLRESVAALRRGHGLEPGRKVVLILDQFEQWLHAHNGRRDHELIWALRQCDGGRVQALLAVRDDFWLAVSRLMRDVDVPLTGGHNCRLVDLFDPEHAERVLAAFGHALGRFPEAASGGGREQEEFVRMAVEGLAEDRKVMCVRLALFAEMMKSRPWTPAGLRQVGGTAGVGVSFLEETFSAPLAPARYRCHQSAVRSVLKALLPDEGTDIKGRMRSRRELAAASGYSRREEDFAELLDILDSELRLISPTEPDGAEQDGDCEPTGPDERYYQLTHDYLVPAVRQWLTGKQRETRRGRAELKLAERAGLWKAKPEKRHLPSGWEWLSIRLLTRRKGWNDTQQQMMQRAGKYHALRALTLGAVFALLGWAAFEGWGMLRAAALVRMLESADTVEVPAIVSELEGHRRWAEVRLRTLAAESPEDSRARLHASLALLPADSGQVRYLSDRLTSATPMELGVIRDALADYGPGMRERFWSMLRAPDEDQARQRLQIASALAAYDPASRQWTDVSRDVAKTLVSVNPMLLGQWIDHLRPVRDELHAALREILLDDTPSRSGSDRLMAASILADFSRDRCQELADLVMSATAEHFEVLFPVLAARGDRALAVLLAELDKTLAPAWPEPDRKASWPLPDPASVARIEAAHGLVGEHFALCQAMPAGEFLAAVQGLSRAGYAVTRVRPYTDAGRSQVAALWRRDGADVELELGLSAQQLESRAKELSDAGFVPLDVAGYLAAESEDVPLEQYAAAWSMPSAGQPATKMYWGIPEQEHDGFCRDLSQQGYQVPLTLQTFVDRDGQLLLCGIRAAGTHRVAMVGGKDHAEYQEQMPLADVQWDVDIATGRGAGAAHEAGPGPSERQTAGSPAHRYSGLWHSRDEWCSLEVHGPDPAGHLVRCRELAAQDYRPVAVSVAADGGAGKLVTATVWHRPVATDKDKERLARRQANAAVALARLGVRDRMWPLLKHQADPRVRSWLIHRFAACGGDPRWLATRLQDEPDVSIRRALLLALGEFPVDLVPEDARIAVTGQIPEAYRHDPDPGILAAAQWLLRKWGLDDSVAAQDAPSPQRPSVARPQRRDGPQPADRPSWYVNGQGHRMVIIPGPVEFAMGHPGVDSGLAVERWPRMHVGRSYAIAAKRVTVEQYRRFVEETPQLPHTYTKALLNQPDQLTQVSVNWYEAAQYCRWLSEKEGAPEDQMCYPPISAIREDMVLPSDYLQRTGYRLPTEAEWEFACRSGTVTRCYFGSADELLPQYAWYELNSSSAVQAVGLLKPNDLGLFDMLGNVRDWCQERDRSGRLAPPGGVSEDVEDSFPVTLAAQRVIRGSASWDRATKVRSADRAIFWPASSGGGVGLRVARTVP